MDSANRLASVVYPLTFSAGGNRAAAAYLADPVIRKLVEFFDRKGLPALKEEDRAERWYEDWLAYQAEHRLYASILSPRRYADAPESGGGAADSAGLDLLRLTRFLEVFAWFSPAHGYSFQVSFLGLFSILMGSNEPLKREAVRVLSAGGLLAFGVSEKRHGADLFGNEFVVEEVEAGRFIARGSKYYIGNANAASIIAVLGRREGRSDTPAAARTRRMPFVLFALRPRAVLHDLRKIPTLGVRSAFVGEFTVKDHPVPQADIIAEGRAAWDAVFGTVTLGKFFLGFGSIGMCEHALEEAAGYLARRVLYGKPVLEMPHIRSTLARAYARLCAMKFYAYRALDYVHAAHDGDRRYLLFNAVQKARVSTEGVKVMTLLSECVGAKGLEADTYFEMALRDIQLIPGLEGSTHVNLHLTAQFMSRYFARARAGAEGTADTPPSPPEPPSLSTGAAPAGEKPYLMEARTGAINAITFPPFLDAYRPLRSVPNVRVFVRQVKAFALFLRRGYSRHAADPDTEAAMNVGRCMATVAYGQLIAEHARILAAPPPLVSALFDGVVSDLTASALALAGSAELSAVGKVLIQRVVATPTTRASEWDFVAERVASLAAEAHPPERQGDGE